MEEVVREQRNNSNDEDIDMEDPFTWLWLAGKNGGSMNGTEYSLRQCYEKALTLDRENSVAWVRLGQVGGGEVQGLHSQPPAHVVPRPVAYSMLARRPRPRWQAYSVYCKGMY